VGTKIHKNSENGVVYTKNNVLVRKKFGELKEKR
jgi:hypothetical protein